MPKKTNALLLFTNKYAPQDTPEGLGAIKGFIASLGLHSEYTHQSKYFPVNPANGTVFDGEIRFLLDNDIIELSEVKVAAPAFLVWCSTGERRMVVDFRELNRSLTPDPFPQCSADEIFS